MDSYLRKDKEMSLANGRSILAIPGPSVIPDRVLNAMHTAAPNIYVGSLLDTTDSLVCWLQGALDIAGQKWQNKGV